MRQGEESDVERLTRLRIEVAKGNMTVRRDGGALVFEPVPVPPASEERRRLPMAKEDHAIRPRTRGECEAARGVDDDGEPNPCPWVSCFYHLALEVGPRGELRIVAPTSPDDAEDILLDAMADTCVLDVADREAWRIHHGMNGGVLPALAAQLLGMSIGRVHRIEHMASGKFGDRMRRAGFAPEDEGRTFRPREAQQPDRDEDDDAEPAEEVAPKAPRVMRGTLFDGTEEWQAAERARVARAPKKSEPKREEHEQDSGTLSLFKDEGEW